MSKERCKNYRGTKVKNERGERERERERERMREREREREREYEQKGRKWEKKKRKKEIVKRRRRKKDECSFPLIEHSAWRMTLDVTTLIISRIKPSLSSSSLYFFIIFLLLLTYHTLSVCISQLIHFIVISPISSFSSLLFPPSFFYFSVFSFFSFYLLTTS